jgi:hypothetical protein
MIAFLESPDALRRQGRVRHAVELATLLGWLVLAAAIGLFYLGHSSSPYGVCYARSGRSVPCAAVTRR